ncbi:MAG: hypothetical protein K2N71_05825 [Oscillospiraceae bacterium]|nr:hypothetical protein [Oscillospiraceae bacterium]
MNIVNKFIAAVSESGIPCSHEFSDYRIDVLQKPMCAFAGVKKFTVSGDEKIPTVQVRITLQGSEKRADGSMLTETAENIIVPAVQECGENISKTEISEVKLNAKTGMLYCEIIFEVSAHADGDDEKNPDIASFNDINIYVEEYSFTRSAQTAETVLISGNSLLHFGGGGTVKIKLSGTAAVEGEEVSNLKKLDALLTSGEEFPLSYGGASFEKVILSKYSCGSKNGETENVQLEFIGICGVEAVQEEE